MLQTYGTSSKGKTSQAHYSYCQFANSWARKMKTGVVFENCFMHPISLVRSPMKYYMSEEGLNLPSLRKAIGILERVLSAYETDRNNEYIIDACIKRFKYCYGLSAKIIKRHLKLTENDPSTVEEMSFQNFIRRAYQIGIIPNSWDKWWKY